MEEILTAQEVALYLRINHRTVKYWIQQGKLEGYKIGKRGDYRVKREAVEKYLNKLNAK